MVMMNLMYNTMSHKDHAQHVNQIGIDVRWLFSQCDGVYVRNIYKNIAQDSQNHGVGALKSGFCSNHHCHMTDHYKDKKIDAEIKI